MTRQRCTVIDADRPTHRIPYVASRKAPTPTLAPSMRRGEPTFNPRGYAEFTASVHLELKPEGVLETVLVDFAARAAWAIQDADAGRLKAVEALASTIDTLTRLRANRLAPSTTPTTPAPAPAADPVEAETSVCEPEPLAVAPYHVEGLDLDGYVPLDFPEATPTPTPAPTPSPIPNKPALAQTDAVTDQWRARLVIDPEVCDSSPVVRGTWITARHVVSLVIDGWSWADILRAHPELAEDDIRACFAFTVEQEEGFTA